MATRYVAPSTTTVVVGGVEKFHPTIILFSDTGLMVHRRKLAFDDENVALRQAAADCQQVQDAMMAKMRVLGYSS